MFPSLATKCPQTCCTHVNAREWLYCHENNNKDNGMRLIEQDECHKRFFEPKTTPHTMFSANMSSREKR